jgi:rRNA small subunit pseudouridine methyltransferase Nep1
MAAAGGDDDLGDAVFREAEAPRVPRTAAEKESHRRVIFVLWNAPLETIKVGEGHELLNCDDHARQLRKRRRDIQDARPDICHQMLLTLMDSPLNKSGNMQIYIHTTQNVLIEVHPQCRIPRTFPRFAGLMGLSSRFFLLSLSS